MRTTIRSSDPRMCAIFDLIADLGQANTTVLIEGETGTGKEVVAGAVHEAASHRTGPFIAVNCAAIPEALIESELLGHEKGAFTSAVGQRLGRFEMANGGTIFLDEIGDMPASMQVKLLRVLQERSFERVGGSEPIRVDVRVIAASNRGLRQLVEAGKFREDLYYRLNVVCIEVPPLRDRPGDIPMLSAHFMLKYVRPDQPIKQFSPQAMKVLLDYAWPGNIRELENVVERLCVTCREDVIRVEYLPPEIFHAEPKELAIDLDRPLEDYLKESVAKIERAYLRKALMQTRGHIGRCADVCGLSRRSVAIKMAQYKLRKSDFADDFTAGITAAQPTGI